MYKYIYIYIYTYVCVCVLGKTPLLKCPLPPLPLQYVLHQQALCCPDYCALRVWAIDLNAMGAVYFHFLSLVKTKYRPPPENMKSSG